MKTGFARLRDSGSSMAESEDDGDVARDRRRPFLFLSTPGAGGCRSRIVRPRMSSVLLRRLAGRTGPGRGMSKPEIKGNIKKFKVALVVVILIIFDMD